MTDRFYQRVVRSGTWYYANQTPVPVHVVVQNADRFYEMDKEEGHLEPGQQPHLNSDGQVYYIAFGEASGPQPLDLHGAGFTTADEAIAWLDNEFQCRSEWK
jgi:hypothetical protein